MTKKQLSILIAALFVATPALADDDPFLSTGSVTAGGIVTDTNSKNKDASKFEEYQDLSNGMLSNFGFTGRNSKSWIDAYGENFGRDDMYVNLRGGMYDVFKARAYTNWIPHNFLFDGITPFSGSGTANLTATFPSSDLGTWNNVNLGYTRKDTGGMFEWQGTSPWYFRVEGNQVKFDGTKNGGSSNGLSPGNGYVDQAFPVQYTTNNGAFEAGYTTRTMTFTGSYMVSNFQNDNTVLTWNNPFFGNNVDRTYLPPENQNQRIALNGVIRALPMNSTLAARYTWDKTTSDVSIYSSVLASATGTYLDTMPNTPTFNGDEKRQTFTLGWSATPVKDLDTKAYFNWQKMSNDSTDVIFCESGNTAVCDGTYENDLWHYKKWNAGVDGYWKINRGNRLGFGYEYNNVKQNRHDFDQTDTNTWWVEWKNTSIDTLSARVKYSYIHRTSDFLLGDDGADANDPAYLQRFVKAFDLANVNQNRVKATLDWSPMDMMGVALEYIYKKNDYDETVLGRNKDTRNEIFANVTYGAPNTWRVSVFGDYEKIKYDSNHRYIGAGSCNATTGPNCFDPSSPPSSASYNWTNDIKNKNWLIGLGVDVPVNDRFMLKGSVLYDKVDASSDMTAQQNFGNPLPLPDYPNVKTVSLNIKGTYLFDRNWSVTGGYAYQKYDYSDDQFNGYTNTLPFPGTTTTSQSYLNGWNANQTYNANIFYLLATFKY